VTGTHPSPIYLKCVLHGAADNLPPPDSRSFTLFWKEIIFIYLYNQLQHRVATLPRTSLSFFFSISPLCSPSQLSSSIKQSKVRFRSAKMAKMTMLIAAICLLPAIAMAVRPVAEPFVVKGRVYCDTCRAGFETPASIYLHGILLLLDSYACFSLSSF